jgi:phosphatidylethanolamine/phosphatidyl-N-methylethanolamine N-methyltransferase
MKIINRSPGTLLEIGVGTGISLEQYRSDIEITAIDLSPDMLTRARAKADRLNLTNIKDLLVMDAGQLEFPDNSFDKVVAMYVLTVVPDPGRVMSEMQRVCKPGGEVIIVNHFSATSGVRGMAERLIAPLASALGWRPEFPIEKVLGQKFLQMAKRVSFGPFGMFSLLRFERMQDPVSKENHVRELAQQSEMAPTKLKGQAATRRQIRE